jgi:hypothetical protein
MAKDNFYSPGFQARSEFCKHCGYLHPGPVGDACPNRNRDFEKLKLLGKDAGEVSNEVIDAILKSSDPNGLIMKIRTLLTSDKGPKK